LRYYFCRRDEEKRGEVPKNEIWFYRPRVGSLGKGGVSRMWLEEGVWQLKGKHFVDHHISVVEGCSVEFYDAGVWR